MASFVSYRVEGSETQEDNDGRFSSKPNRVANVIRANYPWFTYTYTLHTSERYVVATRGTLRHLLLAAKAAKTTTSLRRQIVCINAGLSNSPNSDLQVLDLATSRGVHFERVKLTNCCSMVESAGGGRASREAGWTSRVDNAAASQRSVPLAGPSAPNDGEQTPY